MGDTYKIAIVGSGPGGLSAAAHAVKSGVSHVLLERTDHLSDTIYKYQKGKYVMSTPDVLPLRADVTFSAGKREAILDNWNKQIEGLKANVRYKSDVTAVSKDGAGFKLKLADGAVIEAENVVLAIGLQGNLNKLRCEGADLPLVQYQLDDPEAYEAETIIVIGAGDAGIENAIALSKQNSVVLINRSSEFARIKQGNLTLITNAIEKGDILCYHSAETAKIEEKAIILNTADGQARVACDRHNLKLAHRDAQDFFGGVF